MTDRDSQLLNRRTMIAQAAIGASAVLTAGTPNLGRADTAAKPAGPQGPIRYSLNTATVRGQNLPLVEEVQIAAKAGYQAIEPWVKEIERFVQEGGRPADLKKRIADLGLVVPSAIGFADWINEDDTRRAKGLEQWKRDAELVASIGGIRLAAPPGGAYNVALELPKVAQRYRKLLEIGHSAGVVPELELWGGAKTLCRMGEIAYVLVEAGRPDACGLLDAFHIYKGGSDVAGLRLFNGSALHVFHINDYPAEMPREKITDADRVYPGDGSAPLVAMIQHLLAIGFHGMLSLELFNRGYWKQDALTVARTGLEKTRAVVERAMRQ